MATSLPLSTDQIEAHNAERMAALEDDYASTRHARISLQDGVWVVEDLGSTNGTYLGQRKIDGPVQLDPGVPLRIGKTVLELR